eukprot:366538-Chlamydomonas_euryale.AAC.5
MVNAVGDAARSTIDCTKRKVHVALEDARSSDCKLMECVEVGIFLSSLEAGAADDVRWVVAESQLAAL